MNLYFIVEGKRTEPILYRSWIPQLLPTFREISRIEDAVEEGLGDTFYLIAGLGYPAYEHRIRNAIKDCAATSKPFHLVVCVDAEDVSVSERILKNEKIIRDARAIENVPLLPFSIVIADCCIETWLLGNAKVIKRNPDSEDLRAYLEHYDVAAFDPEKMPAKTGDRNRADTHLRYLQAVFRERNMYYTKKHPADASEPHYLKALVNRASVDQGDGTRHLRSFSVLLSLCDSLNAVEKA